MHSVVHISQVHHVPTVYVPLLVAMSVQMLL
jgi:hypothetical protein